MLQALRTLILHVPDLEAAVAWYTRATGIAPYFHEPFYAGFELGGTELGLDPNPESGSPGEGGATPYWRVQDVDAALAHLLDIGGTAREPVTDVGGGIRVASVRDPFGNAIGVIQVPGEGGAPRVTGEVGHG